MKTIILFTLLIFLPNTIMAKRTITGRITDKNDNPISQARVRAYDYDRLNADDLMGVAYTNSNGVYTIKYEGGRWDTKWPFLTTWRPNIFIKVSIAVNGRCDDGEWNASANWERLSKSGVKSNHRMSRDLTINMKIRDYPTDNITALFTECENMICSFNFFFHYSCVGCYAGKKFEWSKWDTSLPFKEEKCANSNSKPDCTQRDLDDIRKKCNNRLIDHYTAENSASALTENCKGSLCDDFKFLAIGEKSIRVINNTMETAELKFVCKPFKNWKKMTIRHKLRANDTL